MAVVNEYKMYGVTSTAAEGPIKFFGTTLVPPVTGVATQNPLINQTYIIKSLHVTNKSLSNTPTITITLQFLHVTMQAQEELEVQNPEKAAHQGHLVEKGALKELMVEEYLSFTED